MVRLAPINVPLRRRLQTLCILAWELTQLTTIFLTFFLLFNYYTLPFMLLYIAYIAFDKKPWRGGNKWDLIRKSSWWNLYKEYFPVTLHKTHDLDPKDNYIFVYHPHGVIGMGAWSSTVTEAHDFSGKFPGIDVNILTLDSNFYNPFYREYLMWLGLASVSEKSINHILGSGPGRSVMIVVGGAEESLEAHPGKYTLVLAPRRGFVRVALANGAKLVPVFGFGENDIFRQVDNQPGTHVRQFQAWVKKKFGFTTPFFHGRGIFNYDFGLLPYRQPINVVVGKPVECPKTPAPSKKMISEYHDLYAKHLKELYNEHVAKYHETPPPLNIR